MLVTTWLSNIAFQLWPIWLQTLVEIDSESCQTTLFPSFCSQPSKVTVLFNSNLSRRSSLGQDQQAVDLDPLLCSIRNTQFCSYVIFVPRDQWMVKYWMKRWALLWSPATHGLKKFQTVVWNLQSIKTLSTLEVSQYHKSGKLVARFPQASLSLPAATATDEETRPSDPPKLCRSAAPRALPLNFQSKSLIVFSNSLHSGLGSNLGLGSNWQAGAWTWTQTWILPPDQRVEIVLSALKSQNNLCGVWILLGQLKRRNWGQLWVHTNPDPPGWW